MSDQNEERNLEKAQRNQNKAGEAGSNPQTTGPAENLRDKAAKMNDEDETREPA